MTDRPGLISPFKGVSHLVAGLVLLQALLAGFFITGRWHDAKDVHEIVADIVFLAVVAQVVLAWLTRGWNNYNLQALCIALLALVFVQMGLGFAGADKARSIPITLHVPLGVLIFGVATVISTLSVLGSHDNARSTA